jgi:antitoxin component of MazEF toxin-antitoxin module
MPLVRRIIDVGKTSKGIIIPKSWLAYYEKQNGQSIKKVTIEMNGKLIIKPILREES